MPSADLRHYEGSHGFTLLHQSCFHLASNPSDGTGAMLEAILPRYKEAGLLDVKTVVDQPSPNGSYGYTALMFAAVYSKFVEVKLLLQAGASRYERDSLGKQPCLLCCARPVPRDPGTRAWQCTELALHTGAAELCQFTVRVQCAACGRRNWPYRPVQDAHRRRCRPASQNR